MAALAASIAAFATHENALAAVHRDSLSAAGLLPPTPGAPAPAAAAGVDARTARATLARLRALVDAKARAHPCGEPGSPPPPLLPPPPPTPLHAGSLC